MTTLLIVRHGETAWNSEGRFQGQTDIPLNELGRAQARQLTERLARDPIAAVYASDLQRAIETARPLAESRGLPVVTDSRLREVSFGSWEGLTFAEVKQRHPVEAEGWLRDPARNRPRDAESRASLVERLMAMLREIAATHDGQTVAVVTHGGPVKCAVMCALEANDSAWKHLRVDNATVARLGWRNGQFEVVGLTN